MPRSRLGPLAIETKLGDQPSTSSVWRAIHVQFQKAVAVKVFSAPFGGTPEARNAFAHEWERLKLLQHPCLAKCYGGGFEETDAYLAYELIDGETMSSQLERTGRLSWENALEIGESVCEALIYLHEQNIVYGVVSPDKVVSSGLSTLLVDVRIDRYGSPYRTTRPPNVEDVARMAPELASVGSAELSSKSTSLSDLYALGALLYQAVTGRMPFVGDSVDAVRASIQQDTPPSPASIVLECPVWFDRLIMQLLEKNPAQRPVSATAVKMALAEVRKRSLSRAGVAEHASSGFSALQVTNQTDKDKARTLLGREVVDLDKQDEEDEVPDATVWHDQPWFLFGGLIVLLVVIAYAAWPPSEATLRSRAEKLIAQDTRSALAEAKRQPLQQILNRFPDGANAKWAQDQIDRITVVQFLHQLRSKIKNNLPITDQGELLHKQAQQYADNGDYSEAIDKYRSMVTVLGDDENYQTAVAAARYQIAFFEAEAAEQNDAATLVQQRLDEADEWFREGRVVEARKIWYSLIELYGDNSDLKPLIDVAQQRLADQD